MRHLWAVSGFPIVGSRESTYREARILEDGNSVKNTENKLQTERLYAIRLDDKLQPQEIPYWRGLWISEIWVSELLRNRRLSIELTLKDNRQRSILTARSPSCKLLEPGGGPLPFVSSIGSHSGRFSSHSSKLVLKRLIIFEESLEEVI
jgi:hypothetical protein